MRTRVLLLIFALLAVALWLQPSGPDEARAGTCTDPTPAAGGELQFDGVGTPNHTATQTGDVCPGDAETWFFATFDVPIDQWVGYKVIEEQGTVSIMVQRNSETPVALKPGDEYRSGEPSSEPVATYTITITGTGTELASYRVEACRSINNPCPFAGEVPPQPCTDPTPDGGGEMLFKGVGTPVHMATREGDVCPSATESWQFFTVDVAGLTQSVGIRVIELSGDVTVTVQRGGDAPVALAPGDTYATSETAAVLFTTTVTGSPPGLALYQIQVCRSANECTLSDAVTPKPGDVSCDGSIDSLDALLILQLSAGLLPVLPCPNVADVNLDFLVVDALDALILLQYVAGLLDRLPSML